jgi:hypothetical protein
MQYEGKLYGKVKPHNNNRYVTIAKKRYERNIMERKYKVGYYNRNGERVLQDNLEPMTHKQACTFISKMINPANHFIYEI